MRAPRLESALVVVNDRPMRPGHGGSVSRRDQLALEDVENCSSPIASDRSYSHPTPRPGLTGA